MVRGRVAEATPFTPLDPGGIPEGSSAIDASDLRKPLEGKGPFTVFAPIDQALKGADLIYPALKEAP